MDYTETNITIANRLKIYAAHFPELNFYQLLDRCACCPVEYLLDVSNNKIGQNAIKDRRKESSLDTLKRMNEQLRRDPIYKLQEK